MLVSLVVLFSRFMFVFDLFLRSPSVVGGAGGDGLVGGIVFAIYVSYLCCFLQCLRWSVVFVVLVSLVVLIPRCLYCV